MNVVLLNNKVIERDCYTCADCKKNLPGGKGGIVHHKHYDDWGKGNSEETNSCLFLCSKCHDIRNAKFEMKIKVTFWAKRYAEIDGVSDEELRNAMMSLEK
jgi:5-methylcytosine-specific restriction endonuclease McrA